jgi:hypothetical protein
MGSKRPQHRIEVFVDRVEQLFNSMDPSPFHERDLDDDTEEFIVSWAQEFPCRDLVSLVIHVNQFPAPGDTQHLVETAVQQLLCLSRKAEPPRVSPPSQRRPDQSNHRPHVSRRLAFDERVTAATEAGKFVNHSARKSHYRRLGRDLAAAKNLPLRLVACSAPGAPLRKVEPDARGSSEARRVEATEQDSCNERQASVSPLASLGGKLRSNERVDDERDRKANALLWRHECSSSHP